MGNASALPRPSGNESLEPVPRMPFHLLEEITDHFSEDRKLGAGPNGTVYMGELRSGEKIAAVVLHGHPKLDGTKFEKECFDLASHQHKNIVRLVGYCHETTEECVLYNGRMFLAEITKMALCSEYMHNGGLYNFLSDESNGQDWRTRYVIIKGVCDGLKYLHEELESPIYHLDLKPQNILLDERLVPKITNFGLLKYFGDEQEEITKSDVGTLGYLPPEYTNPALISNKFDIFSLGVIIINIMAGPKGYLRSAEMPSHEFIENLHGNWRNRLQETLGDEMGWMEEYCKQVKTCAEIALSCVEADRHKRPTIGIIVNKLRETETICQIMNVYRCGYDLHPWFTRGSVPSRTRAPVPEMRYEPHYMSLQHLKEITKDFSEQKIHGKGGSSVVYKGELENGKLIAVKKVEQRWSSKENCKKAKKQFKNEVKLLTEINHPNIVKLLGHCYETHSAPFSDNGKSILLWQIDCLLCLEFLPESLHIHISDATSGLDWHTRYNIIEGISDGLQYLHEQSVVPIIHLDLKPGNILLDEKMVPKIADFGISRPFDQGKTIYTKTNIGTLGYMPPESVQVGTLSLMSDIFSLGVIIIEVITGHKDYPLDLQASSKEFIDTELSKWRNRLQNEPGNTNLDTDCQQIEKCIQIGLMCLNPDRTKRPTMRKITNILQGLESTTRENGPLLGRSVLGREQGCTRYLHHVLIIGICATAAFSVKYEWWKWI